MTKFLPLVTVILSLGRSLACADDGKEPELITNVIFNVPVSMFSSDSVSTLKQLPDTENGKERFDATDLLGNWGISAKKGLVAVYLPDAEAFVLKGTEVDFDYASRVLEWCCPISEMLRFNVSAWTYLDHPLGESNKPATRFEDIKKIAGDSLQAFDAYALTAPPNRPVSFVHRLAAGNGLRVANAKSLKSPESFVRIVPGEVLNRLTVDFEMEYRANIPQPDAPDERITFTATGSLAKDTDQVVHNVQLPPLKGQDPDKVRRCAIVLRASVVKIDYSDEARKPLEARKKRLIEEALKGLPEEAGKAARPK